MVEESRRAAPRSRSALAVPAFGMLVFAAALAGWSSARRLEPTAAADSTLAREVAARSLTGVVTVRCNDRRGSGFFVSERRLLTNEHVTCGPDEALELETTTGARGSARVVRSSVALDVALLESDSLSGTPLPLGSAGPLAAGDTIMVSGNPLSKASTVHVGTVSNPRRAMLDVCYVQVDARIDPSHSGGPLLDAEGRAVGVVSMKYAGGEGIGLVLPIDYLYEAPEPWLPPPAGHPQPGFSEMLKEAARASEELQRQQSERGMRLVEARSMPDGRMLAVVVTLSRTPPESTLGFSLQAKDGGECQATAHVSWTLNPEVEGLAERGRRWLERKGLGDLYVGTAAPVFSACRLDPSSGLELVLDAARGTASQTERGAF
jgi:Trypsin-like peptidase domain